MPGAAIYAESEPSATSPADAPADAPSVAMACSPPPQVTISFFSTLQHANEADSATAIFLTRSSAAPLTNPHSVTLKFSNKANTWGNKADTKWTTTCTFAPNETLASFNIPIKDDEAWQIVSEFNIDIASIEPSNNVHVELSRTVVRASDDDFYPSNEGGNLLRQIMKDKELLEIDSEEQSLLLSALGLGTDVFSLGQSLVVGTLKKTGSFINKAAHADASAFTDTIKDATAIVRDAGSFVGKAANEVAHARTTVLSAAKKAEARSRVAQHTNKLVLEFWKERWVARGKKAKITAALMASKGVLAVTQLYLYKIIIDGCIKQDNLQKLTYVLAACVGMDVYVWLADRKILDFRGRSGIRKDLRNWLARKWLSLSAAQQSRIGKYRYFQTATFDVEEIVKKVWWNLFRLINLAVWIIFAVAAVYELDRSGFFLLWVFVPILLSFANIMNRAAVYREKVLTRQKYEQNWTEAFGFIADSTQRNHRKAAAKRFEKCYTDFYNNHRASEFVKLDFVYTSQLAVQISLYAFIFIGGREFINGDMELGTFTAILSILKSFTKRIAELNTVLVEIQRGQVSLERVLKLLNMPEGGEEIGEAGEVMMLRAAATRLGEEDKEAGIKVPDWASHNVETVNGLESRTKLTMREPRGADWKGSATHFRGLLADLLKEHHEQVESAVLVENIEISKLTFAYPSRVLGDSSLEAPAVENLSWSFVTGGVYNFTGKGKSTLLKCLAENMLTPQAGTVSFPHHLRRAFVARTPTLVPGLLLDNALELAKTRDDKVIKEAWGLLEKLGLEDALLRREVFCSGENIGLRDVKKIALVAALMGGAEVLLLDRLFEGLNEADGVRVKAVIDDWSKGGEGRTVFAAGLTWGEDVPLRSKKGAHL